MNYDQIVSLIREHFPDLKPGNEGKQLSFWVPWLPRKDGRAVRVKKTGAFKRVASFAQAKREQRDPSDFDRVFHGTELELLQLIAAELEILRSRKSVEDGQRAARTTPPFTPAASIADLVDAGTLHESFDPADEREGKIFVAASIASRSGQRRFRQDLIEAYGETCLISGCAIGRLVEAAHIVPYNGRETNVTSNGLLLRTDLHTLFDLGLLRISPYLHKVVLHPTALDDPTYSGFDGMTLERLKGIASEKALE